MPPDAARLGQSDFPGPDHSAGSTNRPSWQLDPTPVPRGPLSMTPSQTQDQQTDQAGGGVCSSPFLSVGTSH